MNLDMALQTFLGESRELLTDLEDGLLGLSGDAAADAERINAIFRAAHTIKGSAGLFGLDAVVAFTHIVESVLDRVRAGDCTIDEALRTLLLSCRDHIAELIDACAAGAPPAALLERSAALGTQLQSRLATPAVVQAAAQQIEPRAIATTTDGHWHVSVRFGSEVLRNGMDPLAMLRYLGTLGTIEHVATLTDAVPPLAELDAERCYLGYEVTLRSNADATAIADAFEFVREDSLVRVLAPDCGSDAYLSLIRELPEADDRLGAILLAAGVLSPAELDAGLTRQRQLDTTEVPGHQPLGHILVAEQGVSPAAVNAALEQQSRARGSEHRQIRIGADKLDELIDLVGELVIASAATSLRATHSRDAELIESTQALGALVELIRDSALNLRTVPIGETFSRFRRVVHDLSRELGKDIELVLNGEDTELDKSIVERLADPLTHLVRNAIDHGIEPVEARLARGKPARGTVMLNARHDSGSIVIEVQDDGNGLDAERIAAKARERGLLRADQTPSEQDIFQLIFEPGFSTANAVTNLSGRGVGMDVVKRAIEALRGTVEMSSQAGAGTCCSIRLPLTLAIIDGFLVGVGDGTYVIPLDQMVECVELGGSQASEARRNGYINLRGRVLPLLHLHEHFAADGARERRENLVVVNHAGQQAGLVVDRLIGEFQTVIKPLGRLFAAASCFSGATILGSGAVALILDIPGLLAQSSGAGERAAA
ncbi:chemotaxis protein CheA [Plasticicumulans acidivorans]|uniref:Chemotaxis protein CheA n=1 Tax=Plasticicumulans acidivorans TaxID=886464 RepID=A0A317MY15_9GAMM|nr:chemotaxis protein CheA [Plasticicumulans acidivorans]PWV60217.1 two-component system chemotaxis sensor kinase CheA [Plasticicumulans acidivorans]